MNVKLFPHPGHRHRESRAARDAGGPADDVQPARRSIRYGA